MYQGKCLCGVVEYEIRGKLGSVHHCHCSICRRLHGAPFSTFVHAEKGDFRYLRGADRVRGHRASPPCERTFCTECGTRLTFSFDGMPDAVWVTLETLDGTDLPKPDAHMFVASKAGWYEILDGLPQYADYPPVRD